MRLTYMLAAAAALCLHAVPTLAAGTHAGHGAHKMVAPKKYAGNKAVQAYIAAANTMHKAMDVTYTGDADIDFARGMRPHHQGAVDMIDVLLKYGKDADLREKAEAMALWQNAEIVQMDKWSAGRDNPKLAAASNEITKAYQQAMDKMHKDMDIAYTGDADIDFVRGMIPHHQGAIEMAWILVEHGRDPLLREIANDVIRSQQQEIAWMQEWLESHPAPVKAQKAAATKKKTPVVKAQKPAPQQKKK